ncbi:MAG: 7-carboxy-7-deazaguanine synthase QueE, partial [Methanoregula sp.]|nr:7-carboxy-7-deazaguanine synthase QueE [Methanoregula sp.]
YAQDGGMEMSPDAVLEQVWRTNLPYVCITGGEPLLQADALEPLLASLHSRGTMSEIETNGTFDFSRFQRYASICMDVKCPSSGEKSELTLLEKIRQQDSVKFVVNNEADCQYAREVMNTHHISGEIFFSPVHGTDYTPIIRLILAGNLPVRFQIQLHKIIGVK